MASYASYLQGKAKAKFDILNKERKKPNIQDELLVNKSLYDMQKELSAPDREIDNEMANDLKEGWKPGSQSDSGDAFVSGLMGGMKKRSILDDKKKMQNLIGTTEKLKAMVENQNRVIAQQEAEANAKEYIKPRIMAYLDQAPRMAPDSRRVYLQAAMDEYNKSAGTNFQVLDAAGSEPWKVVVSNNGNSQIIDLMDFIKTSEEKKYELYMNSNEMKMADQAAMQEHVMDVNSKQSVIDKNKEMSKKYKNDSLNSDNLRLKREEMIKSGQVPKGSMLFDEISNKEEFKHRITELKTEVDKLEPTEKGIDALKNMGEIFKRHPDISTSLASWAKSSEDSLFGKILNKFVNQDQRNALIELEKHAATLGLGVIGQFKGLRPTDILKKLIIQSNPNGKFTYEAFIPISSQYLEKFNKQRDRSLKAVQGWENRYFPAYSVQDDPQNNQQPAQNNMQDQAQEQVKVQLPDGKIASIPKQNVEQFLHELQQKGITPKVIK